MSDLPWILPLSGTPDPAQTGGKAARLARWRGRGLPVPDGFIITTAAWRARQDEGAAIEAAIRRAWQDLGAVPVAVRSSAIAEDMAQASMAGQYESFLQLETADAVVEAVRRCWASLEATRTEAYLARQGIDAQQGGMAVLVQAMVPAEVAGVLFTLDPRTGDASVMLVEAAWGLGGAVVSGAVQPDVYRLDAATGKVLQAEVAEKTCWMPPGQAEEAVVPLEGEKRTARCLDDTRLGELHALAMRMRGEEGSHLDLEWAVAGGRVHLLQLRPVTAVGMEAEEAAWAAMKEEWAARAREGSGPWVRHNLGETVPRPSPLGWSVLRTFMSPQGGYGRMLRLAGFEPDASLGEAGFLTLICGQIYMDAGRAPRMLGADHALRYDREQLREDPAAAARPPSVPCGGWKQRRATAQTHRRVAETLRALRPSLARELREKDFPEFEAWCRSEQTRALPQETGAWIALWREREEKIWGQFAARAFFATLMLETIVQELRTFLGEYCWEEEPDALLQTLSATEHGDAAFAMAKGLHQVGSGMMPLEDWLEAYGHRGPSEMDLAAPRWSERPEEARASARTMAGGADPSLRHQRLWQEAQEMEERIARGLPPAARNIWAALLADCRACLPFREDAKHVLMRGHDLLRRQALDAGRRLGCGGDIFYLERDEMLDALAVGRVQPDTIRRRKEAERHWQQVHVPDYLDAERLAELGRPEPMEAEDAWEALVLVRGSARGPALVLTTPVLPPGTAAGFILVCPSTDTAWTPLFAQAAGLVLERGGMLSHGAIIARELGLPAVVLAGALRRIPNGAPLVVDAVHGRVGLGTGTSAAESRLEIGPVPPPSLREQRVQAWSSWAALAWAGLLLAGWLLPADWLARPALALGDVLFWPLVRLAGPAGAVALLAAATAAVTLLLQRALADLPRLRAVKTRGEAHRRAAQDLAARAPRQVKVHQSASALATRRLLASAMSPIGFLLGPMIGLFLWIPERIDPATWNAPPGSALEVVAWVKGDQRDPVQLLLPDGFEVAPHTPQTQTLPPIREVLESLLARWKDRPPENAFVPAGMSAEQVRDAGLVAQLEAFLSHPLPEQRMVWQVYPPDDFAGRSMVAIETGGMQVKVPVVLGSQNPPDVRTVTAEQYPYRRTTRVKGTEPLGLVELAYPVATTRGSLARLGSWEVPWLVIYLAAYLPTMFGIKRLLRLP